MLFSSLVDDPGEPDAPPELLERIDRLPVPERLRPTWEDLPVEEQRRQRLYAFIEELVKWESTNDERVLSEARALYRAGEAHPGVLLVRRNLPNDRPERIAYALKRWADDRADMTATFDGVDFL